MDALGDTPARVRYNFVALCLCLISLILCSLTAIHAAWRWPLVGDASLIHYVVFLIHSGRAPYSQIVEINLPGSYLLDYLAMSVFGWGAHGLRLYDGFLCIVLCWSAYLLGQKSRRDRLFCLAGGLVFVLVHLQDGLDQAGQRDFALAVLILCALNVLIRRVPEGELSLFFYELLIGFTLTIKPTLAPLALLPLIAPKRNGAKFLEGQSRLLLAALGGLLTPLLLVFLWLWHFHSVHAFMATMGSIGVVHSHLGRKSLGFLLTHCTSPVLFLFAVCACLLFVARMKMGTTALLLACCAFCGLLSYLDQGKGFPYQRYPFLAAALVLIFLTFSKASSLPGLPHVLSLAGLLYASLWLAPRFAASVKSFDDVAPFQDALAKELRSVGVDGGAVQCLDTYGGCINTLYDLRVPQATGYLYDCYLFGSDDNTRTSYRAGFLNALLASGPRLLVLTNERCFDPTRSFERVREWPELNDVLHRDYVLTSQWQSQSTFRSWSRAQTPNAYRVYIHK